MITIGKIQYKEDSETARIESNIKTDGQADFTLFFEVEKKWGQYLVTDRADAFLTGILNIAMLKGHDIRCEDPVSAELKIMLERQLIHTLAKHDSNFHATKIYADLTETPLENAGAVGTGLSLGLDSFTTIAENYDIESSLSKLTHLLTFVDLVGGFYRQRGNRDYTAARLYERKIKVANELGLPLIPANTNLKEFMPLRVDYYVTYMIIMAVMSLRKLFRAYYISSYGIDFSHFNITNTSRKDCEPYDLLTINCCTLQGGVRFLSGDGEKDRLQKLQVISKFPLARKNLHSCLTQHYNCMICQKCRRNLVSMDALGILDDFSEVYDITYYRAHRDDYIEWMCQQIQLNNHASEYIEPAYNQIRKREPKLIERYTYSMDNIFSQLNELKRQKFAYREYANLYYEVLVKPDWEEKLKKWFQQRNIREIIIYGNGFGTLLLAKLASRLEIKINYVVEDLPEGAKRQIPRLPVKTIDYPPCDAIIICNMNYPSVIERKLKEYANVPVPVYKLRDVFEL